MKLKTFRIGGVHPPENKLTAAAVTIEAAIPDKVSILLSQHLGAPAVPVVGKGDKVKVGTLIGKGEAFISANVHSSVSGVVQGVDDVLDASGYKRKAVIIKVWVLISFISLLKRQTARLILRIVLQTCGS